MRCTCWLCHVITYAERFAIGAKYSMKYDEHQYLYHDDALAGLLAVYYVSRNLPLPTTTA
jgi:hypothetical protein